MVETVQMTPNRALLGPAFKKNQTTVLEALETKSDEEKIAMEKQVGIAFLPIASISAQHQLKFDSFLILILQLSESGSCKIVVCTGEEFVVTRPMVKFESVIQKGVSFCIVNRRLIESSTLRESLNYLIV